jgi:hypothetical protein
MAATLAEQQCLNMEQHHAMLATLNEIRVDIGDIQLRMERQVPKLSSSSDAEQSPPPTPRDGDPRPASWAQR